MEKENNAASYSIGQKVDEGIVFYVDKSGQHGLIAAPVDQTSDRPWSNGTKMATLAIRSGIGQGYYNTEKIILCHKDGGYAALLCAKYTLAGNGDWYLPSIYELDLMYRNIGKGATGPNKNIGGFADRYYWSSTEHTINEAFVQPFNASMQIPLLKDTQNVSARAVRAF
jgi:hypothetical protein